jgi:tetratricopeptide (TPR) repeat protein
MERELTLRAWLTVGGMLSLLAGCDRPKADAGSETASVVQDSMEPGGSSTANKGKIPLSTKSDEAKKLYAEGLAQFDQVRLHDAHQKFQQAAAKDPNFAMAHYQLAITSPSNKEALAHLKQAVQLAGNASEGERLAILSLQAGFNADPAKSLEYAEEAVQKYPEDERARLNLGFGYTGRQDYQKAVDELKRAIALDPNFSTAYNALGYAYRPMGNYPEAEKAFKKYIELVPNDPNPYDSYAELLMKTGRFDESIAQYRKALAIDPHFSNSHYGIASDLMFQGKHNQAIAEAQKLTNAAQNDADRRLAFFTRTVVYADQGKNDLAQKEMERQYALDSRINDPAQMGGDAETIGLILLAAGKPDEAAKRFQQARDLQVNSSLPQETKDDAELGYHYDLARVALAKQDLAKAKSQAAEYLKGAQAKKNDFRIRQAHELAGTVALADKNFDEAIKELQQANQQDPYVLYVLAQAYQGKGDTAKATETFKAAAESYTLPTLNYALIRAKAKQQAGPQPTS